MDYIFVTIAVAIREIKICEIENESPFEFVKNTIPLKIHNHLYYVLLCES